MRKSALILVTVVGISASQVLAVDSAMINSCEYASDKEAQAAWKPMESPTARAKAGVVQGRKVLELPCDFSVNHGTRLSWNKTVNLDLSSARGVQFDFLCPRTLPVSYFNIYFQSGNGWYGSIFFPESATDWNSIVIDKSAMKVEGNPDGWDHIKTIRISAWRSGDENTEFYVSDIRK